MCIHTSCLAAAGVTHGVTSSQGLCAAREQLGSLQVLIFVHSRKETAKTARYLRDKALEEEMLSRFGLDDARRELLQVRPLQCVGDIGLRCDVCCARIALNV